eukprot:CAMPEP_0171042718 /NCGR_PEP_ID=MMETSP0736-20130129/46518_1 /TAXON_ID=186038 /ORGANISM="Fragilariopsis kerguelensis, Strain L26-C5" /LENGTH=663 /DNA_ID=CAMNT_0011491445 /DNA_START=22 /DNA_END=2012 /DNA_ORIENTATION=+
MRIVISTIVFAFVFIAGMVVDAAPACVEDPKLEFKVGNKHKKRNCKWVSKDTKSRCKKKEKTGLKLKLKELCPATCDHCPAKPPTDTPVVVVPTPTPPTDGNGCCSLDFKNCINYCGTDYNSCMTCNSNDIVGWIKSDAFQLNVGQRWTGCGESNNINHSGCCEGLTCQFPNGPYYSACLPPDVNTNPVSPPTPTPVTTPVSNPVSSPTTAPASNPVSPPTTTPVSKPVTPPTTTPTKSPVIAPTSNPVSTPTPTTPPPSTGGNGCCSLDYKNCVDWCGPSYDSCMKCDNKDVTWLSNGPRDQCMERWSDCEGNPNGCCDGLTCRWRDGEGYNACLPNLNPTPAPVPAPPTKTPTYAPTVPIEPTISPAPTPESSLLSTDKAMDAWAVFQGLDYITHKNSADNYALVASGGAAGSGNLVVSESIRMPPDWRHYKTGGSESTGPAPDADEDAIVGIILAVKAVENDANKPSWYNEARKWADASATAFVEFETDNSKADFRLVKLGSCWGGWEGQGNNPSYHSPGSFRVMKDYQKSFPNNLRVGYNAVPQSEWTKLINTSHDVLRAVQCSNDGALVPNWATMGVSGGKIVHTGGGFSGSGTSQYEYGAEAARTTFRVALDAAFYPEKSSEWSPYLSSYNWRLDGGFQQNDGSFSSNTFPSCRGPN